MAKTDAPGADGAEEAAAEATAAATAEADAAAALQAEIDELVEEQQAVMAEEAEASADFKKRKTEIQRQIDAKLAARGVENQLAGLSPEARKQVIASLSGKGN